MKYSLHLGYHWDSLPFYRNLPTAWFAGTDLHRAKTGFKRKKK